MARSGAMDGLRRRMVSSVRRAVSGPPRPGPLEAGHVTMGRGSYEVPRVHRYRGSEAMVTIGDFSSIALDVEFLTGGNHRPDWVSTYPFRIRMGLDGAYDDGTPVTKGEIVVGSDVWIGRGAKVLSGVTIGHGAVVAAYAVVTKDVEPYAIVAGNPGEFKRLRFPRHTVDALLRIRWWEWPDDVIRERVAQLNSPDVDAFVAAFDTAASGST